MDTEQSNILPNIGSLVFTINNNPYKNELVARPASSPECLMYLTFKRETLKSLNKKTWSHVQYEKMFQHLSLESSSVHISSNSGGDFNFFALDDRLYQFLASNSDQRQHGDLCHKLLDRCGDH